MYDINYFSIYKKRKSKNNGLKFFIIVFAALFILGNAGLFGAYILMTNRIQARISEIEAKIQSEETQQMIAEAARIRQEAALTNEYLELLKSSTSKLNLIDYLDTALIDKVRSLTPPTTFFTFAEYNGYRVNLACRSTVITDPMDMYHAFKNDPAFVSVTLTGITVDAQGNVLFSIISLLAGGDQE